MVWGDVLCAAIDACAAGGVDRPVQPDDLPRVIAEILAVRGGMESTYGAGIRSITDPRRRRSADVNFLDRK